MKKEKLKEAPKSCSLPQDEIWFRKSKKYPRLPLCQTKEEMDCSAEKIYVIMWKQNFETLKKCSKPCSIVKYPIKIRADITRHWGKQSTLYFIVSSTTITYFNEYLLFDTNAIVASVSFKKMTKNIF